MDLTRRATIRGAARTAGADVPPRRRTRRPLLALTSLPITRQQIHSPGLLRRHEEGTTPVGATVTASFPLPPFSVLPAKD